MNDKMSFELSDEAVERLQNWLSRQSQAMADEEVLESYSVEVSFTFNMYGRRVIVRESSTSSDEYTVLDDDSSW